MELMSSDLILFDLNASSKDEVIKALAHAMKEDGRLNDEDAYVRDVFAREALESTAIGFNVATPHAKSDAVATSSLAFARLAKPIAWNDERVDLVFQIAVPKAEAGNRHLQILAQLARHLMHEDFREKLGKARTAQQVLELVDIK